MTRRTEGSNIQARPARAATNRADKNSSDAYIPRRHTVRLAVHGTIGRRIHGSVAVPALPLNAGAASFRGRVHPLSSRTCKHAVGVHSPPQDDLLAAKGAMYTRDSSSCSFCVCVCGFLWVGRQIFLFFDSLNLSLPPFQLHTPSV